MPNFETMIREYGSRDEFNDDARKLAKQGWRVTSQSERTQRSGCMRLLLIGLIFPPKPHVVVSYEREKR